MQNKRTIPSILLVAALIAGVIVFSGGSGNLEGQTASRDTRDAGEAVIEEGVQYVDITAHGGYAPRVTKAKAGIPTVIRMKTENTYDCSIALVVPDIGYQSYLPRNGVTDIEVPSEKAQGTLRGMCSMAMYHFEIEFE